MSNKKDQWWKKAVVYEIMTKSFKDSNGDGWGDIKGIIEKLDYLEDLGVNAIWLTPVQTSGGYDNGYDISNYREIESSYGTMEDLKLLINEMKKRDMKLMFDMVMSHTSDKHEWFIESRKGKDNKYSDYYIWSDKKLEPPKSIYGTCCYEEDPWRYDPSRKQYYYHMFSTEMPDLNYSNPAVRQEFIDLLRFYIDLGIEGFRFDVVDLIGKDIEKGYSTNGPKLREYLEELVKEGLGEDGYDKYLTVAEAGSATPETASTFAGLDGKAFSMTFNLSTLYTDAREKAGKMLPAKFDPSAVKASLHKWQTLNEGKSWNTMLTQNHDTGRIVTSKWVNPRYHNQGCKTVAISMFNFRGTPFIYQGEEIGMTQLYSLDKRHFPDTEARGKYDEMVVHKRIMTETEYFTEYLWKTGRDGAKTPMQWDNTQNAGFTSSDETWLPVNDNYKEINVQDQLEDENSILQVYKKLIHLRTRNEVTSDILTYGEYKMREDAPDHVFDYTFTYNGKKIRTVGNWSDHSKYEIPEIEGEIIINSNNANETSTLGRWEGRVYLVGGK